MQLPSAVFTTGIVLEIAGGASFGKAHELSSRLEARIKEGVPGVAEVVIHIEPAVDIVVPNAHLLEERNQAKTVKQIVAAGDALCGHGACHDVRLWREESGLAASLHCSLSADMAIYQAHDLSE